MNSFGVGFYFLTMLWCLTLMLCWISVRTGHIIGKIAVVVTSFVTLVLVILPKGESYSSSSANFYDKLYIPRFLILVLLGVCALIGGVFVFIHVCLTPVHTRKIRSF